MKKSRIVLSVLALALGAFLFVFGGRDDSPGAQLLGVLIALAGVLGLVKRKKKTEQS